mgnify:CR=1 FL=1
MPSRRHSLQLASRYLAIHQTLLFFGGWLGPVLPPIAWFLIKTFVFICIFILFRAALPFLLLMLVWLVIVTYLPALSLWWK